MRDAKLVDADLAHVEFMACDLDGAILRGANLESADFRFAKIVWGPIDLRRARLVGATLHTRLIDVADFKGADLQGTTLEGGTLSGEQISALTNPKKVAR